MMKFCHQKDAKCMEQGETLLLVVNIAYAVLIVVVVIIGIFNFQKISKSFKIIPFCQYFFANKYYLAYSIAFYVLKLFSFLLYLALLTLLLSTGDVLNVKTGPYFFVQEVRGHDLNWYAYVAMGYVTLFYWFAM